MENTTNITISTGTIFKLIGIGILLYLVYLVWSILLLLFVAILLAALIDPFAQWFEQKKIPRGLAVILIYIVLFGLIALLIIFLVPVITNDLPQLVANMQLFWHDLQGSHLWQQAMLGLERMKTVAPWTGGDISASGSTSSVPSTISGVFSTISGFFGGIISSVIVLVITYYLSTQDDPLRKILVSIAPDEYVPYLLQLFKKMRDKLSYWLRAQLLLSLIIGLLVFTGLSILDVRYAGLLALLAAILEFIPYAGPTLATIPALFLSFSQGGGVLFVAVLVLYVLIQQLENHLLVPKIMERAVGLNPVVSIIALLIGFQLSGILGALLAIPVVTALSVFLKDVFHQKTT